jgi:tetratricopeptide (TPR) repeat protein
MFNTSKRNLRIWILAILAISLALFAVACGGGDEPKVTLATSTPKPAEPAPTSTPVPAQDTENAEEHIEAAAAYYADGDYDKAIVELEKIIELEPDNADAYTNLALSYFRNGDYENAAAAWTDVINFEPDKANAYFERGMSYFNLKKYEQAIDDFTQAIDLDPTNADAYRVRGKSHAFMENYEQAIADFTQTIELDPTSDEAYLNRAVSTAKIGKSESDLANIIADCGMALQISENPDIRQQAQNMLETFLENSDDPVLRQQAADALQGKVATSDASETGAEPSLMDIDINRAPGHSIGFEKRLEPGGSHRFLFLASPGDTISAGIASSSDMLIGIQNAQTGEVLGAAPSNDNSLLVTIPQNALYHIVIEDVGGQGGDYVAAFEASPKVSFALDPNYFIIGRLPQGGLLYYTYTAPGGATLQGNVIPHPDTPVDLVVKILDLESRATLFEANESGPGENEQFTFTVPNNGDGKLLTYIVSVEDVDKNKGAYILAIASDAADIEVSPLTSPESVVQAIFDAAKSGDFASLKNLCDPLGENDGDTQGICDLATDDTNREEFVQYFATGRISGDAQISPEGDKAEVPFLFGPDGDREETMGLINRDGQWYLFGF